MPFPPFTSPARVQLVGGPLCGAWAEWNSEAVIAEIEHKNGQQVFKAPYKRTAPDRAEYVHP